MILKFKISCHILYSWNISIKLKNKIKIQMNKLNNLLQNFDYTLTIISTIKYLKTEKFLEIHVLFFCRLNQNIKIANFCTNIIRFYYLRYYNILNLITLIVF